MYLFSLLYLLLALPAPTTSPAPAAAPHDSWESGVHSQESISSHAFPTSNSRLPTLFLSTDRGECWEDFTAGLPAEAGVAQITEHQDKIYLLTRREGLFVLPPNAKEWQPSSGGLPLDNKYFDALSIAGKGDRMVIGTFSNGIYISDDAGASWRKSFLAGPEVTGDLLFLEDRLVAGTHDGVWESMDGGDFWRKRGDWDSRINAVAYFKGKLVIARQNGLGVIDGDEITWSDTESKSAIVSMMQDDDYVYAANPWGEIFRSADGLTWEKRHDGCRGAAEENLPAAMWNGWQPKVPEVKDLGLVTPTSRGWIVGVGGGC